MKLILFLLLLTGYQISTNSEKCSRPIVKRRQVYIYRTMTTINVRVFRCLYNDTITSYSDISDNCILAFNTGRFTTKYDEIYNVKLSHSPVVLEEYVTQADILKNLVILRSGTACRYDRGFCYDPRETISYAAVWNVVPLTKEKCPHKLEQIFSGFADLWLFVPKNLSYLFYTYPRPDKSFALRLLNPSTCYKNEVWFTDEQGYIVSFNKLGKSPVSVKKPIEQFFPIQTKRFVSEAILKDCDLRTNLLNFDTQIRADYLVDPENIRTILNIFQNSIVSNKQSIVNITENITNIIPATKCNISKISNNDKTIEKQVQDLDKRDKEFDTHIQKLSVKSVELLLKTEMLEGNVTVIKNTLNNLNENNKKLQQGLADLKNDLDTKLVTINKNVINSNNYNEIINKLSPTLDFVNRSSQVCLNKVENLKADTDKLVKSLNIQINTLSSKEVEANKQIQNINSSLLGKINSTASKISILENRLTECNSKQEINDKNNNENFLNIRADITSNYQKLNTMSAAIETRLNKRIDLLTHTEQTNQEICSKDMDHLRNDLGGSIRIIKEDFQTFKDFNTSLVQRLTASENSVQSLTNFINKLQKDNDNNKQLTELKLKELVKNTTYMNQISIDNIEDIISKKYTSIINVLNNTTKSCSEEVSDLKQNLENKNTAMVKTIAQNNKALENISSNIGEISTTLSGKIGFVSLNVENLEKDLKHFRNIVETYKKSIESELDGLKKSASDINREISNAKTDILKQMNSVVIFSESKTDGYVRDIENLKYYVNKTVEAIQKEANTFAINLKNIQNDLDSAKTSVLERLNLYETRLANLERNSNKFLNDIPTSIENQILKKIDAILLPINTKIIDYEKTFNKFIKDIDKTLTDTKKEIFEKLIDTNSKSIQQLTQINSTLSNRFQSTEETTRNIQDNIFDQNSKIQNTSLQLQNMINTVGTTSTIVTENKKSIGSLEKKIENLLKHISKNELDILKERQDQMLFINESLENKNIVLKRLRTDIDNNNLNLNTLTATSINLDTKLNKVVEYIENTKKNVTVLQQQITNISSFKTDINKLTDDLNKNEKLVEADKTKIETLNTNISTFNLKQINTDNEIQDLRKQIEDMKNSFQKLLDKKDDEIIEIKAELKKMSSCCSENKESLKQKGNDIENLKSNFTKAVEEFKQEFKYINETFKQILPDTGGDPSIVF